MVIRPLGQHASLGALNGIWSELIYIDNTIAIALHPLKTLCARFKVL